MSQISSSDFERACDEIERFVNSKGGKVTPKMLYNKFRGVRGTWMREYMESLDRQGRVVLKSVGAKGSDTTAYVTPVWQEEE